MRKMKPYKSLFLVSCLVLTGLVSIGLANPVSSRDPLMAVTGPQASSFLPAPVMSAITPNPSNSPFINLTWSAVATATDYDVYVSTAPINSWNYIFLTAIADVLPPTTTYTDKETTNGTYYYAVVAYNGGGGLSAPSNSPSVTVALSPVATATYLGVVPGNSFLYTIEYFSNVSGNAPFDGVSNGSYSALAIVDNTTDNGITATIGWHLVLFNATNSSLFTTYSTEIVGAYDTMATFQYSSSPAFFINEHIMNKTYSYYEPYFTHPGSLSINATWDSSGVLDLLLLYVDNVNQAIFITAIRVQATDGVQQVLPASANTIVNDILDGVRVVSLTLSTTSPVQVTINYTTTAPPGVPGLSGADAYVQLTANNTGAITFPVTMSIYYNATALADAGLSPNGITIWWYNTTASAWVALSSTVDSIHHVITVTLDHFSVYSIKASSQPGSIPGFVPSIVVVVGIAAIACIGVWIKKKSH